ncbi:MAG TPA: hypothetical protein VGD78_13005 [Chthoniobacterales bacterium]
MRRSPFLCLCLVCLFPVGRGLAFDAFQLPEPVVFHYDPSSRDPFISAAAAHTLVTGEPQVTGVVSARILERYLQMLSRLVRDELFVEGLSTGDGDKSVALINGVEFHSGDRIPVPVPVDQIDQLEALAHSYGLPLSRLSQPSEAVLVQVGQIKPDGVCLVLPGFKSTLCEIAFAGDETPNPIQLERKRTHP